MVETMKPARRLKSCKIGRVRFVDQKPDRRARKNMGVLNSSMSSSMNPSFIKPVPNWFFNLQLIQCLQLVKGPQSVNLLQLNTIHIRSKREQGLGESWNHLLIFFCEFFLVANSFRSNSSLEKVHCLESLTQPRVVVYKGLCIAEKSLHERRNERIMIRHKRRIFVLKSCSSSQVQDLCWKHARVDRAAKR